MLNQFFYDWNTAIQSRTIVNETRNPAGVITMQETRFKFRDVEITMFSRILPGSDKLPPEKRRWASEMFVPSTNKIIPSVRYTSKARCAAEILAALIPGRAHEDLVEARNQNRRKQFMEKLNSTRKARLAQTSFTPEDQEFILDWIQNHVVAGRVSWDDTLIDILCEYHAYITGVGLADHGINLNEEAKLHVGRMYNTACQLISEAFTDKKGLLALTRGSLSRNFLAPRDNIKYGVYVVRSGYAKIFDKCTLSTKFMHVISLIAEYYARVTGQSIEDRISEMKAYREKQKERKINKAFKGHTNKSNNTVATYSTRMTPIGSTIGDAFGDILDQAVKAAPKKAVKAKAKTVSPVTDGQINGKQMEQPKTEKEVVSDRDDTDLPEAPEAVAVIPEDDAAIPSPTVEEAEEKPVEKPKRKYTRKKKAAAEEA